MTSDRRTFLKGLGAAPLATVLSSSIARAMALPANHATRSIKDIEHIVILMQENRSFDHYFGTLRGVRGFGDPRPVTLSTGNSVWYQPTGAGTDYVLPFHPTAPDLGLQFLQDLAHDWDTTHQAWNLGAYDQWVPAKTSTTMAYLTRDDVPFHYALADAFTICDAYHCSLLGPTDPNRYHMWTGWVGNDGSGGGPVIDNAEAGYGWSTYPERLQAAGVTWKIYQDVGEGLDAAHYWGWTGDNAYIGNYGDNSLLYFFQYQNATPGQPLYEGALVGTNIAVSGTLFDMLIADIGAGNLPQVSWVVAPEAYTEHPNWPANYGAWYVSQVLDALTANPDVWSKTALFICFDENDGFFDHMVPPTPPASAAQGISTVTTENEIFAGNDTYGAGPYGLGVRVPMIVVSPWSKGGWVSSEVFDHTSLIRFIEKRFGADYPGINEPNITRWRRAVVGDLTSLFDFDRADDLVPVMPSTTAYVPPDNLRHADYVPTVPATQSLPAQEPGLRLARPVPYRPHVKADLHLAKQSLTLHYANHGTSAAVFHVRSGVAGSGPWSYTVGAGSAVTDSYDLSANAGGAYSFSAFGPNGYLRSFAGAAVKGGASLAITELLDPSGAAITITVENIGAAKATVTVVDAYMGRTVSHKLHPDQSFTKEFSLQGSYGWYDLSITLDTDTTFLRRLAGHIETGQISVSDPMLSASL
jgi:phospholipase C